MKDTQPEAVLEAICTRGCQYVNILLNDARSRDLCEEFVALNQQQKTFVIHELQSIMSVYEKTGSCNLSS